MASLADIRARLKEQESNSKSAGPGDNAIYPFWNMKEDVSATLRFLPDGQVVPADHLSSADRWRAKETIRVFNLNGILRHQRKKLLMDYQQTVEFFYEVAQESAEREWRPLLEEELENISGEPFETAIVQQLRLPK